MKNPLKKFKSREKKKSGISFYLPIVLSFLPAFLLYQRTANLLLSGLVPLSVFSLTLLYRDEKGKKAEELEDALLFYKRFYYYSALKNDYQGGFYEALESLPLSEFKDRLKDHIEKEENGVLPLAVTKTREEFRLIGYVNTLITTMEEYTPENRTGLKKRIDSFVKENQKKTRIQDTAVMTGLLLAFLLIFLTSLLGHE